MLTYDAKYRLPGELFWRRVRGIKGDWFVEGKQILALADGTMIFLPLAAVVVFGHDRERHIREKMETEAGQSIGTRR